MPPAPGVHQRVAGTAVEAERRTVPRQDGQVADAADVEHRHRLARAREHGAVKRRHQRRALSTGGHVAGTEVGDDVDAAELGEQGRVVQLQRVAGAIEFTRSVAHRLAVGADGAYLRRRHLRVCQQLGDDL